MKKLISLLLCICMLASLMPVYAFAEEGEEQPVPEEVAVPEPTPCPHDYVVASVVESTCTQQGYTVYTCSICGDSYNGDYAPLAEHVPSDVAEVPASCSAEGKTAGHVCAVCGALLDGCAAIPKTEHTPEEVAEVPATCTAEGRTAGTRCSVCGEELSGFETIEKADHTPVAADAIVATCTEHGREAGTVCAVCGAVIDGCGETPLADHTPVAAEVIPATCTEAGREAGTVCAMCGAVIDGCEEIKALGHTPEEVEEIPAEIGKAGTTAGHICEVCGEIIDGCEEIPALEETVITIEQQPQDAEPKDGEVIFSVIASVNTEDKLAYQWQKLDESITYATDDEREAAWKNIDGETLAQLLIKGLDDEEALATAMNYAYRCVITAGEVTEKSKEAHILKPANAAKGGTRGIVDSGTCGDSLTWELTDSGVLTISGTGAMADYANTYYAGIPWYEYGSEISTVVIGENVTSIGSYAFIGFQNITNVTISNTVTRIGDNAFSSCIGLTGITIPASVVSIGRNPFSECYALSSITVVSGNPAYCSDGTALYTIDMGQIIHCAATYSGTFVIPSTVTSIGWSAFRGCSHLSGITIPESVRSIGDSAFRECTSLTNVTIPSGVTAIGSYAFTDCTNLASVTISASVSSIGDDVFAWCGSLTGITVSSDNGTFCSVDGVLYTKDLQSLICCPGGYSGTLDIPSGVTGISNGAFCGCSGLTGVTLSSGVTNIGIAAFIHCDGLVSITIPSSVTLIDSNAFTDCSSLEIVYFEGTEEQWNSITISSEGNAALLNADIQFAYIASGTCGANGDNLTWTLDNDGVLTISGTGAMADYTGNSDAEDAFSPWYSVRESISAVVIEQGVTSIGDRAFSYCTNLTSITLPASVTRIGDFAIYCCSSLQSLTIPSGVTSIGNQAVAFCNSLASISVESGNESYISVNNTALYTKDMHSILWAAAMLTGTFEIPSSVTDIGYAAFGLCSGLSSISIPTGVTEIAAFSFEGCSSLVDMIIPEGVTNIGVGAFEDCNALESITIPSTVTHIYGSAFCGCNALENVYYGGTQAQWTAITIEDSENECLTSAQIHFAGSSSTVTASGTCGAQGDNLTWTLDSEGTLTISGTGAMKDYYSWGSVQSLIRKVVILPGVTNIASEAFARCGNLSAVTLPDSIISIGNWAFEGTAIQSITVPKGVTSVGKTAFWDCSDLQSIDVDPENTAYCSIDGVLFSKDMKTLEQYPNGKQGAYIVPEGVETIAENAFYNNYGITEITLPESLTKIEKEAFLNCGLRSIHLPAAVRTLEPRALETSGLQITVAEENPYFSIENNILFNKDKTVLIIAMIGYWDEEYQIPASVQRIAAYAFQYSRIKRINIHSGVSLIEAHAFENCEVLRTIQFEHGPEDPLTIESGAFIAYYSTIGTTIVVPDGENINPAISGYDWLNDGRLTSMQSPDGYYIVDGLIYALRENGNELSVAGFMSDLPENVVIPETIEGYTVTEIKEEAFRECTGMKSVSIPESITSIGFMAFSWCYGLTEVYIPESVINIGEQVFYHCDNLLAIEVAEANPAYCTDQYGVLFTKDMTVLMHYPLARAGEYYIPLGVVEIARCAFNFAELTAVGIPVTVTTIEELAFNYSGITDVYYGGTEALWRSIEVSRWNSELGSATIHFEADVWEGELYQITLIANNGHFSDNSTEKTVLIAAGHSFDPSKWFTVYPENSQYVLDGWYDLSGTELVVKDGESFIPDGNVTLFAKWVRTYYIVTLEGNGGLIDGATSVTVDVTNGAGIYLSQHQFYHPDGNMGVSGWYFDDKCTDLAISGNGYFIPAGNVTLYAKWFRGYTVSFIGNGATSGSVPDQVIALNTKTGLNANQFRRTGYTFTGWNRKADGSGTKYADGAEVYNLSQNTGVTVKLYAQWKANKYKIAFNAAGGTGSMANISATYGKTVTLTANAFKRSGYTFIGWSTKVGANTPEYVNKASVKNLTAISNGTVTLYAVWVKNSYRIVFNANKGTGDMSFDGGYCYYGESYTLPICSYTRTGFEFMGWNTKADGSGKSFEDGQEIKNLSSKNGTTITLYAQWAAHRYSIFFAGNGATSGNTADMNGLKCGKTYTLTANGFARKGYTFLGWSEDRKAETATYKNKAKKSNFAGDEPEVTLYAIWQLNEYKITYKNVVSTDENPNPGTYTYESEDIELSYELNRPGYTFEGWYKDSGLTKQITVIPHNSTGAKTVYAKWTRNPEENNKYKIEFNGNGETSGSMNPMNDRIFGKTYTLTANGFKKTGYTFLGWSKDPNAEEATYKNKASKVCFNEDVMLFAVWKLTEYKITYKNVSAALHENDENPTTYTWDETVALAYPERPGYEFRGWYVDSKFKNQITEIPEHSTGAKTLYARWAPTDGKVTYSIKFLANGGKGTVKPLTGCVNGKVYTLTANAFKRTGYKFTGWSTEPDAEEPMYLNKAKVGNLTDKSEPVKLYAVWEPTVYDITYKNVSEELMPEKQTYTIEDETYVLPSLEKEGYVFLGWYTTSTFKASSAIGEIGKGTYGNKILYAKWMLAAQGHEKPDGIQQGTVLSYWTNYDVPSYSPWIDNRASALLWQVYDNLVIRYESDITDIQPGLAESWEITEDNTLYTFHIRQDAYFSDGVQVDANAFVYTWDNATREYQPRYFSVVDYYEAVDDFTLVIKLKAPSASFLNDLCCQPHCGPVSPIALAEYGPEDNRSAVGCGPYMIDSYTPGEGFVLKANANYYNELKQPSIETVNLVLIPEENTALLALQNNEIDYMTFTSVQTYDILSAAGWNILQVQDRCNPFWFNARQNSVFQDPAVREALCHMIDWNEVNRLAYNGLYGVPDSIFAGAGGYTYGDNYSYDPELGLQILADAGYRPEDIRFTMLADPDSTTIEAVIVQMFNDLGLVNVNFETLDGGTCYSMLKSGTFEVFPCHNGYSEESCLTPYTMGIAGSDDPSLGAQPVVYLKWMNVDAFDEAMRYYNLAVSAPTYEQYVYYVSQITRIVQENNCALGGLSATRFHVVKPGVSGVNPAKIGGYTEFCYMYYETQ